MEQVAYRILASPGYGTLMPMEFDKVIRFPGGRDEQQRQQNGANAFARTSVDGAVKSAIRAGGRGLVARWAGSRARGRGLATSGPCAEAASAMLLPPFAEEFLSRAAARTLFYPTLLYTVLACHVLGPRRRRWFDRVDATVVLGALPLRGMTEQLVKQENVRGVITMNEPYETRLLCNSLEEWRDAGVEQLTLSTVDFTGVPSPQQLHDGVAFALKYAALGHSVYVHCKAGRSRSATMVAAYLIQVHGWDVQEACNHLHSLRQHVLIRPTQREALARFAAEAYLQNTGRRR
ncbi:phosphatidylglycerophosphatase and protein-tyrosine phosphatase 1 isoform X2 [Petromyzon marinus]|uniref:Phosphatidylglycerophosphatase and protein-tyrosine phosphatase 1 n=1 Tax=Petromyzon marinus TaxID=7757 RepID=A0AAJ7X025_PETMA|nr:phosphatidylglycerophosphatase and protein-tyrosine phosphatase 1 isoform X2 [Petromyzon marinus]